MLTRWLELTDLALTAEPHFYVSNKRMVKNLTYTMPVSEVLNSPEPFTIEMMGYAQRKINMLKEYYYNEESVKVALSQLEHRRKRNSYGSTGVTTFNHFSKRERPTHGPCIQSVVFTHTTDHSVSVNVFYRTTELFKKFAADLIFLRDVMLPQFEPNSTITFNFANATWHPMYWIASFPYRKDPIKNLEYIRKTDPYIFKSLIRWNQRYIQQDESIFKFKQAWRVSVHLHKLADPIKLKELKKYCAKHYIPTRNEVADDEDE